MKHVKLLDCTLRDGGYVTEHKFDNLVITEIIEQLSRANIDIVECGFLKDCEYNGNSTIFPNINAIKVHLPKKKNNTSFVAMIDYGRFSLENLTDNDGDSIDSLRNCFFKKDKIKALSSTNIMHDKGYKVYIQPIDILAYSDKELLELIEEVNDLQPYAFSIVDTFGSMYPDDLKHIFEIINFNLNKDIIIGFHSHNNLQLSFALSQIFVELSFLKREVIIDCTLYGLGRGAGNTNTELMIEYLNSKWNYQYNIDMIFDVIDMYLKDISFKYTWGYDIKNFIAGIHSTHVHNVTYLIEKHNINSKDMNLIIESLDKEKRKRYNYDNLEKAYLQHFNIELDDCINMKKLEKEFKNKSILLVGPGQTIDSYKKEILNISNNLNTITISVNYIPNNINVGYAFFNNIKRYKYSELNNLVQHHKTMKLLTNNIEVNTNENILLFDYQNLLNRGLHNFDNSLLMILKLLSNFQIDKLYLAGFDGFELNECNYTKENKLLETYSSNNKYNELNIEITKIIKLLFKNEFKNIEKIWVTPTKYNLGDND